MTLPRWSDLSTTAGPDPWSPDLSNATLHQGLGCNWTASLCVQEVHRGDLFRGCVWFFLLRQREVGLEVKDYSDLEASCSKRSIQDLFLAYLTFLVLDSGIILGKVSAGCLCQTEQMKYIRENANFSCLKFFVDICRILIYYRLFDSYSVGNFDPSTTETRFLDNNDEQAPWKIAIHPTTS